MASEYPQPIAFPIICFPSLPGPMSTKLLSVVMLCHMEVVSIRKPLRASA